MIPRIFGFLLLALAASATAEVEQIITPAPAGSSPWRFGAGAMWRNVGKLSVDPNFQNSTLANRFFIAPGGAGEVDAFADRTYDDGFVHIGAATPGSGLTTNWGYQNDSQAAAGSLTYLLSGGSAQSLPGAAGDVETPAAAPYLELSYLYPAGPSLIAAFTAHFSLAGLSGRASSAMTNSLVSVSDRFALNGVIPPSAPFSGSFAGPGPLIGNRPSSRDFILTPDGDSAYRFAHDTDLYSLALGTEIHWMPTGSFGLGFGFGAVMNLADWNASWNMPLPVASGGSTMVGAANSGGDFLWGLYVKGSANYRINGNWGVEGFFRYDWNETLRDSVGPSSFSLGLSGWSAGFGVVWQF